MSTIEELIELPGNKTLRVPHNSVEISFAQMIAHIDKLLENETPGDIKLLLKTFKEMALEFFDQYELSLLIEINKQKTIQDQVKLAIDKIGSDASMEEARVLLIKNDESASIEYNRLLNSFPTLLQYALDKLKDEWQRLNALAIANRTLTENMELFKALTAVVEAAAYSVGVQAEKISIVPGSSFALYFFSYLKNFAILTVPIYSVKAPWEWSIFWHELAGYKVRKLKNADIIDAIHQNLVDFHNYYKKLTTDTARKDLVNEITRNNKFSLGYLTNLFSTPLELDLGDFGSFEHQFAQMLANLPKKDQFQTYERMKEQGWCVDWFEELFEDTWSVLSIGENFLPFFEDTLSRHNSIDDRHPPADIRLAVANEILKLSQAEPMGKVEGLSKSPITLAAEQILKFVSLLLAASCKFETNERYEEQVFKRAIAPNLFPEEIGRQIGDSIINWSIKILKANNKVRDAKTDAEGVINTLSSDEVTNFLSELQNNPGGNAIQIEPSYKELLDKKNYLQLLGLSFYDVDFGVATVTNVFYKTTKAYDKANLSSVPADVNGGFVKYETSVGTKHTTIDSWNVAAAPNSKINP